MSFPLGLMLKKRREFSRVGQVSNTEQSQEQNESNALAKPPELGPADTASEEADVE